MENRASARWVLSFGLPDSANQSVRYGVKISWVLGIIATRSFDQQIPEINDLVADNEGRIRDGLIAYDALDRLRQNPNDAQSAARLRDHAADLGFALLLRRYVADPRTADDATIAKAAVDTVPNVAMLFWCFRIMVALGFYFIALFALIFWDASHRTFSRMWLLRLTLFSLPLPWLAAELGWIVAEYGRQPWAIDGVLPTLLAVSSVSAAYVVFTLAGFVLFYSSLLVIDIILMAKYIRMGPAKALGLEVSLLGKSMMPAQ